MNKSVLLAIHPTHMNNIMKGLKIFEYRRRRPKQEVSHIVFYCTSPINMIVAIAEVGDIVTDKPGKLWDKTSFGSGLSRAAFREYFNARTTANAFVLGNVYKLSPPLPLRQLACVKSPPQSFCYLSENDMACITRNQELSPSVPPSLFFIGGVHGVGKTALCASTFNQLGYEYYTASALIKAQMIESDQGKRVSTIHENQTALLGQLTAIKLKKNRIFLDGHFTLLNRAGEIEPIDISVFETIKPSGLILVKADPCDIALRLKQRDGASWDHTFLERFQAAEEQHASTIANHINVPLYVISNGKTSTLTSSLMRKILCPL